MYLKVLESKFPESATDTKPVLPREINKSPRQNMVTKPTYDPYRALVDKFKNNEKKALELSEDSSFTQTDSYTSHSN